MNLRERQGKKNKVRAPIFGSVPGFEMGYTWQTRDDLSSSWVHRPKSANVHAGAEGVYSVLINRKIHGRDNGFSVIYTGPKIKESKNIGIYNHSLIKNCQHQNPLRVVRGAKSKSPFAPRTGFRFDGLYVVDKYWKDNNFIHFNFRRLINQGPPPWIRQIPEILPTLNQEQRDDDITPYTSNIRFQSRSIVGTRQWKKEIVEEDDTRSSSSVESNETEISPFNNSPPLSPEIDEDTNHPPTANDRQSFTVPELPPPEEQDDFYIQPQYVGGMPAPKICDVFKEEITSCSGLVVTEVVPQLEIDEELNESIDYEEEQAEDVELESDIDFGDEEIEVDSQLIHDAGDSQIVTAISLSQSSPSISHLQKLEFTSEIDIEDGPKFAHTIAGNSDVIHSDLVATEIPPDTSIATCETVQHLTMENVIKMDCDNNDGEDDEVELIQPLTKESPAEIETKIRECLYIYPGIKCENDDEVEQAIINGNFHWYQGNRPLKKKTKLTSYTLHEYQEKLVETIQPEASVIIDDIEQDNVLDINTENSPVSREPLIVSKPDSTSHMANDNTANQCRSGNAVCPYKDITLAELLAYTVNQPLNGCMCHWENRLPCMKYCVEQILRARESNGLAPIQEIEKEQIMTAQHGDRRGRLGEISGVESLVSAGCSYEWSNRDGSGFSQHSVFNFEMVSVDEEESSNHMEEEILQDPLDIPASLRSNSPPKKTPLCNAEVFWRGLGEIRAEALRRGCKNQDSVSVNNDGIKKREELHSSDENETSREVEDKVSKKRKNMFLNHHRRKRKRNLTGGEETDQSSQTELTNQQRRRLTVRLESRNIQTDLTHARIVHINNNLTSSVFISPDKEFFNDSLEDKRNVVVMQVEDDGSNNTRSFESYSERTPQFLVSSTEKHFECTSNEVNITNSSCDDTVVDVPLKKRLEDLSTRTHSSVSKKDWGKQTAKKRGRSKPSQLTPSKDMQELSSSPNIPIICNVTSLSNDNIEKKTKVLMPSILDFDIASNEESNDLNTADTRLSSSPSSDTASFERVCNELCEGLPSNKQENWDLKKALPGGDIRRKGRPRARLVSPLKALKELQLPAVASKKYVPPRLNTARNLKGFTSEDLKEIKRKKDILDVIIEEHLVGSCFSNKSITDSKNEEYTMKKSDANLRPKSTRHKQKVLSDNICYF